MVEKKEPGVRHVVYAFDPRNSEDEGWGISVSERPS